MYAKRQALSSGGHLSQRSLTPRRSLIPPGARKQSQSTFPLPFNLKSFKGPRSVGEGEDTSPGAADGFSGLLIGPSARLQGAGPRGGETPVSGLRGARIFGGNGPVICPPSAGGYIRHRGPGRERVYGRFKPVTGQARPAWRRASGKTPPFSSALENPALG